MTDSAMKISEMSIQPEVIARLPAKFVNRYQVVPLEFDDGVLTLATSIPENTHHIDDIGLLLGCKIKVIMATTDEIEEAIKRYYSSEIETVEAIVSRINLQEPAEYPSQDVQDLQTIANEAPVIKLVNLIIAEAVKKRASDIHLELFDKEVVVRYRIDGVLYDTQSPPQRLYPAIISRIKIMAGMNIAEQRLPQDGRIELNVEDRQIDIRVSTLPALYGESLVLRLLDKQKILLDLEEIGFSKPVMERYQGLITRSSGIILVTGPTGSGKTTTLYASLNRINSPGKKIITLEDPIEYQLKRINQLSVRPKIGFSFAQGLRSMLRHDPDIMMVGEIRDLETAQVAVQAALTGHLVFSTLHTNDAVQAITRLHDMGVEDFLIASSIIGILAQRLVRLNCQSCLEKYTSDLARQKADPYRSQGCQECNQTGFKGRTGIFELLVMDESIRELILEHKSVAKLKEAAVKAGMITLFNDGWQRCKEGLTTIEEVLRVVQE